ncbi:hypothetical protein TIFTF001_017376 [Ficus carica]|uniref:Uncharacterized protein n=1 Tax=Ficus carica TaxID=3494 RepID=A0AA88DJ09_FICCA|nr:hypothetical protein TIFTF001_017376 [Ficus carica]
MSKPTKLTEKNITHEKRSLRVMVSAYKRPPAEKSSKKLAPKSERRVAEEGLKRKQGEIEDKESKKPKSAVEEKILKAEEVFHNIVMRLTDHSGMGVALWFEATRAAICNAVENRLSSKRRPLKKSDKVHYSIAGFPHALLIWAYESLPTIAAKFTTTYVEAIPRML